MNDLPDAVREAAIAHLWNLERPTDRRAPYLYALLDAAQDERIHETLCAHEEEWRILPLYEGRAADELAAVAPYLVALDPELRVFDWLWRDGWGKGWGIFLWSLSTMDTIRSHLRRLTRVKTEDGEVLLFRFYDPRVLETVLPVLDERQLAEVFGTVVQRVVFDDGTEVGFVEFHLTNGKLRARSMQNDV